MTQLDVLFRYGNPPSENATLALARVRDVYGIRRMEFDETAHTIRVEYDASRLTQSVVHQLLRRAGLDLTETISLILNPTDTVPAEPVAPSVAQPGSAPNATIAAPAAVPAAR
ncbi:MAG: hypothetical protein NVSMB62_13180 [Acidobacteriaceae bacterium]